MIQKPKDFDQDSLPIDVLGMAMDTAREMTPEEIAFEKAEYDKWIEDRVKSGEIFF